MHSIESKIPARGSVFAGASRVCAVLPDFNAYLFIAFYCIIIVIVKEGRTNP